MNALRTTLLVALADVYVGTGAAAGAVAATPGPDNASGDAGPPSDLPDQVPDFVGGILDSVNEFLGGGVDDLGETVSDIAGNGAGEGDGTDAENGTRRRSGGLT
ncbi:hypothetical protein DJ77_06555 [Halorubrum ezzemoulense]|nr:hypothetical protein DJ77_06555 [Halorubrum ezzemoulense]